MNNTEYVEEGEHGQKPTMKERVVLRSDLSWYSNTSFMVECLRRLRTLGVTTVDLVDVYTNQIHSLLYFSEAVWHHCLTNARSERFGKSQKSNLTYPLDIESLLF